MVKQCGRMVSFFPESSQDWWNHYKEHPSHGLMSFRQYFGACAQHQTVQLDSLPFSWCMAPKQCSLVTLNSIHLVMPCTRRKKPRKLVRTALISEMKHVSWPCPGRQYTSRSCFTTTTRRSAPYL